jgi:hypothetical protein
LVAVTTPFVSVSKTKILYPALSVMIPKKMDKNKNGAYADVFITRCFTNDLKKRIPAISQTRPVIIHNSPFREIK